MTGTSLSAVSEVRAVEFPHLDGCTFLNAASFGPLPRRSRAAAEAVHRMREEMPARFAEFDFVAALDRCRAGAARLVGAERSEIALGPNTSFGLNLAASLLPQARSLVGGTSSRRSTILVSDREFPANVLPWLGLRARGFTVEIVDTDERGFPREDMLAGRVLQGDVALLAVSSVQFASGYRADLARLGEACRGNGTLFVVDAIQSAGALPIDVRECSIDILACGGQKWLCAPPGSGFAYVRRELCTRLEPPLRGWLALTSTEDFGSLLDYEAPLHDDARRFELGTPGLQDQLALAHSIEMLLEVGVDQVEAHTRNLLDPLLEWIEASPRATLASPPPGAAASAIVCLSLPDPEVVFDKLTRAGVVCALREGVLRFAPHLYNTKDEIDGLVRLLDEFA